MKVQEDVLQELGRLPKSLSELYSVIYAQITESGPYSKRMAEMLLQWLLVAQRPLGIDMAIELVVGENIENRDSFGYRDLLNVTSNLIVIRAGVIQFAHLSVREYLESRAEYARDEVHMHVAMHCLKQYINVESALPPHDRADIGNITQHYDISAFKNYGIVCWAYHLGRIHHKTQRDQVLDLLRQSLFRSVDPSCSFTQWRNQISILSSKLPFENRVTLEAARTPFLAICIFGINELLNLYSESEILRYGQRLVPISESRFDGMNGLHIATYQGHFRATKTLLIRGMDVNQPTAGGETCLHLAVKKNRNTLLQLLIHRGANTSALSTVSSKDEMASRASEISSEFTFDCSLHGVDSRGLRSSLGFRVGAGTIDSALDEPAVAPLHDAALRGFGACVSELLRLGADVNVRDSLGATPLLKALEGWHSETVQKLLDAHADVHMSSMYSRTPLHLAATSSQYQTALLLLRYRANPHLEDSVSSTAIQTARRFHHGELADRLMSVKVEGPRSVLPQGPRMLDMET